MQIQDSLVSYAQPTTPVLGASEQWRLTFALSVFQTCGVIPLEIRPPLTQPVCQVIDGIIWELYPLSSADQTPRPIPLVVYNRLRYLEAQGIPMTYIFGEERGRNRPNFVPVSHQQKSTEAAERAGWGIAGTLHDIAGGIGDAFSAMTIDPILIVYIPLNSLIGLYAALGRWEH